MRHAANENKLLLAINAPRECRNMQKPLRRNGLIAIPHPSVSFKATGDNQTDAGKINEGGTRQDENY